MKMSEVGISLNRDVMMEKTFVIVQTKWDSKCLREGDNETTCDKLMKSKWNSNELQQETWREDLHHMAKTAVDL